MVDADTPRDAATGTVMKDRGTAAPIDVAKIDAMPEVRAREALLRCCASPEWVDAMIAARPFGSEARLLQVADDVWWALPREAWFDAFAGHPRIGADVDALREKFAATQSWSSEEQAGVAQATQATLDALVAGNVAYEKRFGYIFIVCATGKTAAQMLSLLEARLDNHPEAELRVAAEEQRKITHIRLAKIGGAESGGETPGGAKLEERR